ncbi:MAG: DUF72 domain-containing protein [Thermoleophilia bacterium]
MALYIGTSGWAYPEWKPAFYPEGTRRDDFLRHYASVMGACEINATFYRLQSADTMAKWAAQVPEDFRFVVKAHRRLTHSADGGGDGAFLEAFLDSLSPLDGRLGAILVQFPQTRQLDLALMRRLVEPFARAAPVAVEFRHDSWNTPQVRAALAAAGATVCLADTGGSPPAEFPSGPLTYVRLRGERYDDATRGAWLAALRERAEHGPVFAFAKHEGVPAGDPNAGVSMAEWMASAG